MKVYLAGAIAQVDQKTSISWRDEATAKLAALEIRTLCPIRDGIDMSAYHGANCSDGGKIPTPVCKQIYVKDMNLVAESNALLVNGTALSEGTAMEVHEAYQLELPIIIFGFQHRVRPSPFMQAVGTVFVDTLDEAIECLKRIDQSAGTMDAIGLLRLTAFGVGPSGI